jgi:low-affinity inorganic phosphate transporter
LSQFYQRNNETLGEFLALGKSVEGDLPEQFRCNPQQTEPTIAALLDTLKGVTDYHSLTSNSGSKYAATCSAWTTRRRKSASCQAWRA